MRIKDLTTVLNKLEELGFGDTELYTEIHSFGISKEMSFIEKNCKLSNCFELHTKMMNWKEGDK